jgi:hypothetical protein
MFQFMAPRTDNTPQGKAIFRAVLCHYEDSEATPKTARRHLPDRWHGSPLGPLESLWRYICHPMLSLGELWQEKHNLNKKSNIQP